MRKYRGLKKDKKLWAVGWYCEVEGKHYIIPENATTYKDHGVSFISPPHDFVEVIPGTVGQQIGRKDKDKKEIWEGDIVEFDIVNMIWDERHEVVLEHRPETWRKVVEYKAPKFIIHWYPEKLKIIGNIHEHPNLLEHNGT